MSFAPDYVTYVLRENFEDAKAEFVDVLLAIHRAHLTMLEERGIVAAEDAAAIRAALASIDPADVRRAPYDAAVEDLFFHVERLIVAACGEEAAGRLHTARSRNDIDMTMYRMRQRQLLLLLASGVVRLRGVLLALAGRHRETLLAAHTHTQPAQPTTLAHYLLAVAEQLERDSSRLRAAYAATNRSPLGACAITGTGFAIDRARTAALLGFDGPTGNTYGSIATVDYLLESLSAAAVLVTGLGRVVQDLLLWCTSEFGYLRLADGYVQCSSIMPQKRNPVALEHARSLASRALGEATGVLIAVHNTPFGDVVDTEDDLQPLVFAAFRDATRAVGLVAAALEAAEFDRERLAARAGADWITVTELADTLVRDHALPFRTAHAIAARLVDACARRPEAPRASVLADVTREAIGRAIEYDEAALAGILSARRFVEVRRTHGGPSPVEIARALDEAAAALERDREWLAATDARLRDADRRLGGGT